MSKLFPSLSVSALHRPQLSSLAGTLTAQHPKKFNFGRRLTPSYIRHPSAVEAPCPKSETLLQTQSSITSFPVSEISKHDTVLPRTPSLSVSDRPIQCKESNCALEKQLTKFVFEEKTLRMAFCSKPGSGRTKFFEDWVFQTRKSRPKILTTFVEIRHSRIDKDYLYQVKHVLYALRLEMKRVLSIFREEKDPGSRLNDLESAQCARLEDLLENDSNPIRARKRLTTEVRVYLEDLSSLFDIVFVVDGVDTFIDRDNEGSNSDDVADYLTCFPKSASLVVSVASDYNLTQSWRAKGWTFLELSNNYNRHEKFDMLSRILKPYPIIYPNILLDVMGKCLKSPVIIDLIGRLSVAIVKQMHNVGTSTLEGLECTECSSNGFPHVQTPADDSHDMPTIVSHEAHVEAIDQCAQYLNYVYKWQGDKGLFDLTLERLEITYSSSNDGYIVCIFALMLLSPSGLSLSRGVLASGISAHVLKAVVNKNPSLLKITVHSDFVEELYFSTATARAAAMNRYFGTSRELFGAQAIYIRDIYFGASAVSYRFLLSFSGGHDIESNFIVGTAVALLNASAVQSHQRNGNIAYRMAKRGMNVIENWDSGSNIDMDTERSVSSLRRTFRFYIEELVRVENVQSSHLLHRPCTHQRSRLFQPLSGKDTNVYETECRHAVGSRESERKYTSLHSMNGAERNKPRNMEEILRILQREITLKKLKSLKDIFQELSERSKEEFSVKKKRARKRRAPLIKGAIVGVDNRHIESLKKSTIKSGVQFNWYRLSRSQFQHALVAVFGDSIFSRVELDTIFDAIDWKPEDAVKLKPLDGARVSWQNFLNLLTYNCNFPTAGDFAMWKLSDNNQHFSLSSIAARARRHRVVQTRLVCLNRERCYVSISENGDVVVFSQKTKQILQRLSVGEEGEVIATDVCYLSKERVCAVAVIKEEAPLFSAVYFFEPMMEWKMSDVTISFEGRDSPPTAIASFYGSMPAPTRSGFTTESFTLFIVGTREGDVRFGSLNDFVHDKKKVLAVRPRECTSTITRVEYVHDICSIVCSAMDGNVYLIPFLVVGDIISGLAFEQKGEIRVFQNHSRPVLSFQYVPESKALLTAGLDTFMLVWRLEDFKVISYIKTGSHGNRCAVILEEQSQVISLDAHVELRNGFYHQGVHIWNMFGGTECHMVELTGSKPIAPLIPGAPILISNIPGACGALSFDPVRKEIILGSHNIRVIDTKGVFVPDDKMTHEHEVIAVFLIGDKVVTIDNNAVVRLWNKADGTVASSFLGVNPLNLPDNFTTAATCDSTGKQLFLGYNDGNVASWRLLKGESIMLFRGDKRSINSLSIAKNSDVLVGSLEAGDLLVWSILATPSTSSEHLWRGHPYVQASNCIRHSSSILSILAFHLDDKHVIFGGDSQSSVLMWKPRVNQTLDEVKSQWYDSAIDRPSDNAGIVGISRLYGLMQTNGNELIPCFAIVCKDGYLRIYARTKDFGTQLLSQTFSGGYAKNALGCTSIASCKATGSTHLATLSGKQQEQVVDNVVVGDCGGNIHVWCISEITYNSSAKVHIPRIQVTLESCWKGFTNTEHNRKLCKVEAIAVGADGNFVCAAGADKTVRLFTIKGAFVGIFGQKNAFEHSCRDQRILERPRSVYENRKFSPTRRASGLLSATDGVGEDQANGTSNFSRESSRWQEDPRRYMLNTIETINHISEGRIEGESIHTAKGLALLKAKSLLTVSPALITENLYVRRENHPQTPMNIFRSLKIHVAPSKVGENESDQM